MQVHACGSLCVCELVHYNGYASEVEKQLKSVKVDEVKIEMTTAAMKVKCAQWMISAMQEIQKHPEIAVNGFKATGILSAVTEVTVD